MTKYLTDDNAHFHFMRFPGFLLSSDLNETCQILYMLLLDRSGLSRKNGWVDDDGTLYQEYTVVIYLSDTNEEQVHAAADELLQVFDQSSVLIQKNPTNTEFYSGK